MSFEVITPLTNSGPDEMPDIEITDALNPADFDP